MTFELDALSAGEQANPQDFDGRLATLLGRLVPELASCSALEPCTRLWALGLDSLSLITLFADLEDTFALTACELRTVMHRSCTIGDILALVRRGF